jgi:hypothetical protein
VHEYDPDDALAASALTIAFIYQLALRELVPVERLPAGCTGDPKWHGAASRDLKYRLYRTVATASHHPRGSRLVRSRVDRN